MTLLLMLLMLLFMLMLVFGLAPPSMEAMVATFKEEPFKEEPEAEVTTTLVAETAVALDGSAATLTCEALLDGEGRWREGEGRRARGGGGGQRLFYPKEYVVFFIPDTLIMTYLSFNSYIYKYLQNRERFEVI